MNRKPKQNVLRNRLKEFEREEKLEYTQKHLVRKYVRKGCIFQDILYLVMVAAMVWVSLAQFI